MMSLGGMGMRGRKMAKWRALMRWRRLRSMAISFQVRISGEDYEARGLRARYYVGVFYACVYVFMV